MRTSNFFFFLPKCHKYLFLMLYHHPHLSKERASQLSLLNGGIEEPESRKLAQAGSGELHSATGRPQAMRGRQDPTGLFCPWGWAESLVQLIHYSPCKVCKCQAQSWGFWFRLQSIATFHGIAPKSMDMPHPWRLSSVKNHQALEVSRMQWLLVWVGRVLKAHPVDRDTFHYARFLQAPSNLALTTPRDGAATAVPVFNLIYRAFAPTLEIFIFTIFAFPRSLLWGTFLPLLHPASKLLLLTIIHNCIHWHYICIWYSSPQPRQLIYCAWSLLVCLKGVRAEWFIMHWNDARTQVRLDPASLRNGCVSKRANSIFSNLKQRKYMYTNPPWKSFQHKMRKTIWFYGQHMTV